MSNEKANGQQFNQFLFKESYLALLSHELKTPLNTILGCAHLLRNLTPDSPEFFEALNTIHRNAEAQAELVNSLIDASCAAQGGLSIRLQPFRLCDLTNRLLSELEPIAANRQIQFTISLENPYLRMVGDENRIGQVLKEILKNAFKFTPERGSVTLVIEPHGNSLEFRVHDTGKGIPESALEKIFSGFWQEDMSDRKSYQGLGLGLYLAKHIVDLHGGTLAVHSDVGRSGTTVRLIFPSVMKHAQPAPEPAPSKKPLPSIQTLRGLRLLVVDDQPDSLFILRRALIRLGAQVTCTQTPFEAIELSKSETFDVILSDVCMPEMDGVEMIQRIRDFEMTAKKRRTPSFALTATLLKSEMRSQLDRHFDECFTKPIDIDVLCEHLRFIGLPQRHHAG